ncbi:MAG: hypothetical protein AAF351_02575 [Pseudomonadota bacterium]
MQLKQRIVFLWVVASVCVGHAAFAQDELTGMYRLTRPPAEIVNADFAEALDQVIPRNEKLQWQVFVPDNYEASKPAGLFLYLDPDGSGLMPDQWRQVFTQHNIIWVSPRRTTRREDETRRTWHGILGSRAIAKDYNIDLQRMYVGGYEGTVRTAIVTMLTANEFSGALYVRGSYYSDELTPDQLQAMQRKYHVFISSTNDKQGPQVRRDYERYQQDGIYNSKLIFELERMSRTPTPEQMDEVFEYLGSSVLR